MKTKFGNKLIACLATFVALAAGDVVATVTNLNPSADAYVSADPAEYSVNFGSDPQLVVGQLSSYTHYAFLKFDPSPIPAHSRVVSASLTLTRASLTGGDMELRVSSTNWSESTITYGTMPAVLPSDPSLGAQTVSNATTWTLSSYSNAALLARMQTLVDQSATNNGYYLRAASGTTGGWNFYSRDNAQGIRPVLSIDYVAPAILFSPTNLVEVSPQGQNGSNQTFTVANTNSGSLLIYSVSCGTNWLSVSPTNATSGGETNQHVVSFNTAGLATGTYYSVISLIPQAGVATQSIPVRLLVGSPNGTVLLVASPTNGGTMAGGGTAPVNSSIQISATAKSGWSFTGWNDGITQGVRFVTVPIGGTTYTGSFVRKTAALVVSANPTNGGSTTGGGTYNVGDGVQIAAMTNSGWSFVGWNDGNFANPRTVTVPVSGASYIANFVTNSPQQTTVVVLVSPTNGGAGLGGGTYNVGDSVQISAALNAGWSFINWDDGTTQNLRTISVPSGGGTYTANLLPPQATIGLQASPTNGGTVSGGGTYSIGSTVPIAASPASGWVFSGWNDGVTTTPRNVVVPSGGTNFTANFLQLSSSADIALVAASVTLATGNPRGKHPQSLSYTLLNNGPVDVTNGNYLADFYLTATNAAVASNAVPFGRTTIPFAAVAGASVVRTAGVSELATMTVSPSLPAGFYSFWIHVRPSTNAPGDPVFTNDWIKAGPVAVTSQSAIVANDFDGDGLTDPSVFYPSSGTWYLLKSSGDPNRTQQWGWSTTLPVPADFDGDGITDVAVFNPPSATWYIIQSASKQTLSVNWGFAGVIPVPGDYDGDGKADRAVFYPANGNWYIFQSSTGTMPNNNAVNWGFAGVIPVAADYDGDGKTDLAVFYPASGNWYIRKSSDGQMLTGGPVNWGWNATLPVSADFDGDGKADIAAYYPASGMWYIRKSSNGQMLSIQFGFSTAIPVPGDYDGDGKADCAVFNPASGMWYVRRSIDGQMQGGTGINWGWSTTVPVPPQFQINRRFFPSP